MTAPDVAVADEAAYAALASGEAETVSADAFGCGCVPVRAARDRISLPRKEFQP